jgi:hypothetical protein
MSFSMRSRIPLVAAGVLVFVALVTFLILDQTGGPASPSSLPVIQIGQVDPGQAQPDAAGEAGTPAEGPDTTALPAGTDGTGGAGSAGSGTGGPSDTGTTGTTGTAPTSQGGTVTTGGAGPTTTTTVHSPTTGTTTHETVHGGVHTGGPTTTGVGGGGGSGGGSSSTTTTGHR